MNTFISLCFFTFFANQIIIRQDLIDNHLIKLLRVVRGINMFHSLRLRGNYLLIQRMWHVPHPLKPEQNQLLL
jgi:hypothetical protein